MLISIFITLLFTIPSVQTYFGSKLTTYLNEEFDVDIDIENIGLTYTGAIDLKKVLVKDHHQDTLLYAGSIATSILNLRELSNGQPELGNVSISDVLFYMKIYKDEDSDNLMTFVRKFKKKSTAPKKKFRLTTENIHIDRGRYTYTNENLNTPKALDLGNITADIPQLKVDGENVYLTTELLSFTEHRGLIVENLQTQFSFTSCEMNFKEVVLQTQDSKIAADIVFLYESGNFSDFVNAVEVNANFKKAVVSTNDLIPFYKEFGEHQNLTIQNTRLQGVLNDFKLLDTDIKGLDRSSIKGNIRIQNAVTDLTQFKMDGDFEEVTSNYYDLVNLMPRVLGKSLPKQLYQLGSVTAKGNAIVTIKTVDVDMELFSQLGKIKAFVLLGKLDDIKKATYNGNVISNDFNIGGLLSKKTLGKSAFNIDVDGSGFTLENLDTKLEGTISSLVFNTYNYTNITVEGNLKDPVFDGKLVADDPNVKLHFNGVVDVSESINNYDFVANVDFIDLKALNIFTRDSISVFEGDVTMNVTGTNINNAEGNISFSKTLYKNQNDDYYFEDFEVRSSFDDQRVRTIAMNSPDIIEGTVKGIFRFQNVYDLFRNSIGSLYSNFEATEITDNEFMEFNFNIYNKIVDVFFPEVRFAPNTFIRGKVESDESEFKLTFRSPKINAFDNFMEDVDIQVDNKNPLFNTYVAIDSVSTKQYKISEFSLINVTLKDTLFMRSEFKGGKNNADKFNVSFYHTINEDNNSIVGLRKSDLLFKGYTWYINETKSESRNTITFDTDFQNIFINSLILTHKDEEIKIDGILKGKEDKDIRASFKDVDLYKITPTIANFRLAGGIDGAISIKQDRGVYFPSATIQVDDLKINDSFLGQLRLNVSGNEDLTQYTINSKLLNGEQDKTMSAIGTIDVAANSSDVNVDVSLDRFDIKGFSPLGGAVLSNMRGFASGDAKITGSYKNPNIDGLILLNNAGLKIPYLNVDLGLQKNARVILDTHRFTFDAIDIHDTKYGTKGVLDGFITHERFSKWKLGLDILAKDRLLVLDTEEDEESLYFGTGFIKGNASITGPTKGLVINVNATTEEGTVFKIPLRDTESLGDNSFIHFLSPEEKTARLAGEEIILEEVKGLELNFDLDVNNKAEVEVVIDKNTGSSLKGKGAGSLLIEINTNGKFKMWGDFIAYEGVYNFRYGAFIEKVFSVRTGGSINWDGSPTRAILDLSAIYATEANPAVLLENATLNRKIPVNVVVDLKGELVKPNLNFNIEFPNLSSVVKSELEYQLEDQATKELQALSLVTQGQFYSDVTVGQNAITGNLVERASSLVNGIFSGEDDKFQIGLNYVQGDRVLDQETTDQFGVTVSTKISNKILINGRVGVPIGGASDTPIVGNVEVEYLFNKDGSLRGKIFNRENDVQYIGETSTNMTGVGLSYSADFDNFNELWKKIFKKKNKDTVPKVIDSTAIKAPDFINFTE